MRLDAAKKQKGFTLVEVIVVAVIVAALAAVAIGVYLQYVKSSRDMAAANAASSIAAFCGACDNSGLTPAGFTSGTQITGPATITCPNTPTATSVNVPSNVKVTIVNVAPRTVVAIYDAAGATASPSVGW